MSTQEKVMTGAWASNLAVLYALNPHDLAHGLSVLVLYGAVFFLYLAPLHAALAFGAMALARARLEGVENLLALESVAFWLLYWGMVFELVPLYLRV